MAPFHITGADRKYEYGLCVGIAVVVGKAFASARHEQQVADPTTFKAAEGLSWVDGAGRSFNLPMKELADWRGDRAAAGRIAPKGFPKNNKFGNLPGGGKANGDEE